MKHSEVASRYARALFSLAKESGDQDKVFDQIRIFSEALKADKDVAAFLASPLIRPSQKQAALEKVVGGAAPAVKNFLLVLAKKNRLALFDDIVHSLQSIVDESHGVTRGLVKSSAVLAPADRKQIEEIVSRVTKKQVILTYKEDPSLFGGLTAEVGSFTFDDSLFSHLNRINEQLNRSAH